MKNILIFGILILSLISCESDFLDKQPESDGYTFESVFGDSVNYRSFVEDLVARPALKRHTANNSPQGDFDDISDNSISGATFTGVPSVQAAVGDFYALRTNGEATQAKNGTFENLWSKIRKANVGLSNIDYYPGSEQTKNRLIGICYFYRAESYFELIRRWGGMPYLYQPLNADDDMDLPRLGYQETMKRAAMDFDSASMYLPVKFPDSEWGFPTKVAAMGMKARALLYAASEFAMQDEGAEDLWEEAALAADAAIRASEEAGYGLVEMEDYYYLFKEQIESVYMKEVIYGRRYRHNWGSNSYRNRYRPPGQLSGNYGTQPNQLLVDCFEMQATGLPIDDPESGYNPQDPYIGRDPRFEESIIHNGQRIMNRNMQIWNVDNTQSPSTYGSPSLKYQGGDVIMGYTQTGYYNNKWMGKTFGSHLDMVWPDLRMSELYLNFAEAANEAWSSPAIKDGRCLYSAEEALNLVRNRAKMPNINSKFLDKAGFRERTRNERRIELCFEDHRLFDIRRWKIAHLPEYRDIWRMFISKVPTSEEYPTGFKYTKELLKTRVFEEKHYLFVIKLDDANIGANFNQNPGW
ncbi:RagB/SusD family nutrient uptake outer membrane protein [Echinicola marina]|uniref:RagB/SusD family nutrient uptake outer membrane protein n=1 Tax=Echinicola marina TaxID=2859768 RepID=UPI001CF60B1E|nr:RagB/SusD family nutrient uptake outer membrane protein [Echinicola marina]UCS94034.1 RagB/SusD family nutrient uptake outer membrane protein [Echinicola marina]